MSHICVSAPRRNHGFLRRQTSTLSTVSETGVCLKGISYLLDPFVARGVRALLRIKRRLRVRNGRNGGLRSTWGERDGDVVGSLEQ